ncbi:hypothetical protein V1264_022062 [Littorina saxatilis]|uniref:Cytochrome P450 n=2 Tax=Littorina saxatilis TaxID=31220 RepID=A0AAN9FYP5_9CAEN
MNDGNKAFLWWLGPFRCVIACCHPDTVKVLLRSSEPKSHGGGGYDFLLPWIGEGLLTAEGKKWERNRRLLTPAFHFEILRDYIDVYNSVVEEFMDKMEKASGGERYVEASAPLVITALDTLLRCALSYNDNIQLKGDDHPYVKAVKRMSALILERSLKIHLYPEFTYKLTKQGKEYYQLCDYVHNFTLDIIAARKKQLAKQEEGEQKTGRKRLDFLDILLTSQDEQGQGLTDTEIRDEVDTFTFAGHDTTSTALGWCLYALGRYQDIQERVFKDVENVMGNRAQVQWEDLTNFQYLPLFIRETMRVYTIVPTISRQVSSPLTIEGVHIPKGVVVDINIYQLHTNPNVWENPMEFNPNRFEKEVFAGRDPYVFVPFSAGPRNCIGQNFAMNEIKTMVACIVKRFHIEADPDIDPEPYPEVTLRPKNGIHLKFTRR